MSKLLDHFLKYVPKSQEAVFDPMDRSGVISHLVTRDKQTGQAYLHISVRQQEQKFRDFMKMDHPTAIKAVGREYLRMIQDATGTDPDKAKFRHIKRKNLDGHPSHEGIFSLPIEGMNLKDYTITPYEGASYEGSIRSEFGTVIGSTFQPGLNATGKEGQDFWAVIDRVNRLGNQTQGDVQNLARVHVAYAPQPTLMDALKLYDKAWDATAGANHKSPERRIIQWLEADPEQLARLNAELEKAGITSIGYSGHGATGVFLKGFRDDGHNTVLALRSFVPDRVEIPHYVHPLATYDFGKVGVEILPEFDVEHTTKLGNQQVTEAIAGYSVGGQRFEVTDGAMRNYGLSKRSGTHHYLDGDGLYFTNKPKVPVGDPAMHASWIHPDGTWQQYHDYRELHEAFNSPMHQQGGKLVMRDLGLEAPATSAIDAQELGSESDSLADIKSDLAEAKFNLDSARKNLESTLKDLEKEIGFGTAELSPSTPTPTPTPAAKGVDSTPHDPASTEIETQAPPQGSPDLPSNSPENPPEAPPEAPTERPTTTRVVEEVEEETRGFSFKNPIVQIGAVLAVGIGTYALWAATEGKKKRTEPNKDSEKKDFQTTLATPQMLGISR